MGIGILHIFHYFMGVIVLIFPSRFTLQHVLTFFYDKGSFDHSIPHMWIQDRVEIVFFNDR